MDLNHYKNKIVLGILLLQCSAITIPALHILNILPDQNIWPAQTALQLDTATTYRNDASQLNLTQVQPIQMVQHPAEMQQQLREILGYAHRQQLKVSIAGAQHSMGGHTLYPGGIVLDMLPYKQMHFDAENNILSIGSGALWQDAIAYLDGFGKSIAVMQSFSNFSVGGSISVNAHGWQKNAAPLSSSVVSFTLMNAAGEILNCSRTENAELFKLVVGGYGLFGIILDVKLKVVENSVLKLKSVTLDPDDFVTHYQKQISNNPQVVFAYGRLRISKKHFLQQASLTYFENIDVTGQDLKSQPAQQSEPQQSEQQHNAALTAPQSQSQKNVALRRWVFRSSVDSEYGKRLRWDLENSMNKALRLHRFSRNEILNEHSSLIENKDPNSTDILQEYFVPKQHLAQFIDDIRPILHSSPIDLLNITLREVRQDQDAYMNYAREDVFGLVFLFNQKKTAIQEQQMQLLSNQLLDAALKYKGTYYLPYRLHIGRDKMRLAYPQADQFFALKLKYDPEQIFNNQFYQHYR